MRRSAATQPALRYSVLTLASLGAIYWLSSLPDLGPPGRPVLQLVSNLSHAPLYAGLAFCWVKALSAGQAVSLGRCALAFLGTGACAVLDEWHQVFVPGRDASVSDFLVDLAGIGGMLLILRVRALR